MIKRKKTTTEAQPVKRISPLFSEEMCEAHTPFARQTENEETIGYQHFQRGLTEGVESSYLTIKNCVFTQHVFIDCSLKHTQIWDVRFENCDLSNVNFSGSALHRVEFVDCKLVGTNLSEATLHHVLMRDCHAHYINLSMSKMSQVQLARCDFSNGAMIHNRMNGVQIDECRMSGTELFQTSLKGIDLRTAHLEGVQLNVTDLRGAIVTTTQAIELLPLLGVVIKE